MLKKKGRRHLINPYTSTVQYITPLEGLLGFGEKENATKKYILQLMHQVW